MDNEMKPLIVRPGRAAQMLDMSKSKVYDAIHRGELPALRIAGQLRISVAAIEKLLNERLAVGVDQ
jgi:excisionase family DNA binding protein